MLFLKLSRLLLNYYCNFIEIFTGLISSSSPCTYMTVSLIEWFLAVLWPLKKNCVFSSLISTSVTNLDQISPQKLLVRFPPNFIKMFSTKSNCAYYQYFPVQWFVSELLPFNDFSSPEHIVLIVSYCYTMISVVCPSVSPSVRKLFH